MTIDVTADNDAPTAADNTVITLEDTNHTFIEADFGFSDVDVGDALVSVQITTLETVGTLQLSDVDVTLDQVILVADITAGNLVFVPVAGSNGAAYDTFGFSVNDGTVDSVASYTMTIDVTAVNDAPTAADNTVIIDEDTNHTFVEAEFNFADVDVGDALVSVQITTLETVGTLQLSDVDVTLDQVILVADITAGNLVFVPAVDGNGTGYDSFEFTVNDGDDDSVASYTMTVDVTADNDAPVVQTIDDQEVTETREFSLLVIATDPDNEQSELSINEGTSTLPSWLTVNGDNPMLLVGTPENDDLGINTVSIILSDGIDDSAVESFNITVIPALSISNVRVNTVSVTEDETTTNSVKPNEEITVQFTVTNGLDHAITGISAELTTAIAGFTLESEETINLNAETNSQITLTGILPLTTVEGEYNIDLAVEGRDYNDSDIVHSDSFSFSLDVQQDAADVSITNLNLEDEEGITCKSSTTLTVEYTNRGENDEDDVVITVTGPNDLELSTESDAGFDSEINSGEELTYDFSVPTANFSSGSNSLTVTVSYRDDFEQDTEIISITKNNCLDTFTPAENNLLVADGENIDFSVGLSEEGFDDEITWTVTDEDGVEVDTDHGDTYTFSEDEPGTYTVTVTVRDETNSWTVQVTDVPLSDNLQVSTDPLILENAYGKIEYYEIFDLEDLVDLDEVVSITEGQIAIDSTAAPQLDEAAQITIKKNYDEFIILASENYGLGPFEECPNMVCRPLSSLGGEFVFEVSDFSPYKTYRVEEKVAAAVEISEIYFEQVNRGEIFSLDITVTNTGTYDALTSLSVSLEDVDTKYNAEIVGSLPSSLDAGTSATVQLQLTVPDEESSNKHSIGTLKITSTQDTVSETIYLSAKSFLEITDIEVNGDNNGDLKIDEDNEITVTVKNDYTEDMEDVEVTVTILDVDGDDLDEDAEEQDIDAGKDEDFTVTFDLSKEDIDEEKYEIEVVVEGTADDGTRHEISETIEVGLDLEKHKVVIKKADLAFETMQCNTQDSLRVTVENIGKNDEDEVELRVINSALGVQLSHDNIKIDKFTDSDNEETENFLLNLEDTDPGTYTLNVELYLDGDLEDSETVELEVKECLSSTSVQQTQDNLLAQQLQQQLQQQLYAQQIPTETTATSTVRATFRDSTAYLALLGVMIFLAFVGMVLAMTLFLKKRRISK
ncbi:MAG: PKD domain-containing protein [Nanoarchaeota archaeon]|nr:PKD domain-containing protein [Nanoarchaeota archaeon]